MNIKKKDVELEVLKKFKEKISKFIIRFCLYCRI